MTVLRNNFNGGPAGTTVSVANSGQDGDVPWYTVNNGSGGGGVLRFTSAEGLGRPTADFVLEAATFGTATRPHVIWYTEMGAQSEIWVRFYAYFTVLPNNVNSPAIFATYYGGGAGYACTIGVNAFDGPWTLFLTDTTLENHVTTTASIPQAAWFRVEAHIQFSTTVGFAELRYYAQPDSDVPTETITFSNANFGAAQGDVYAFAYLILDSNLEPLYLSGIELSNEGWPGPAPFRPGKGVPGILSSPVAIHTDTR